ncbi:DUF4190 domain-containing protein [Jeotgalibacillus aurantiacus]|uniref:DUF4190 domain-containing protein n=1 Tax=Jeotgalibacillus aurantiacus TaxID=2763266 RepID=UPI001D0B3941|nr:DUF4190 domain-containing protein [Jeotgalibacillus aurantiacus]
MDVKQTNSNSIVSLTLGILSLLIPLIGLILGIAGAILGVRALSQIVEHNGLGKGLAISGIICSGLGLVGNLVLVLSFVAFFMVGSA